MTYPSSILNKKLKVQFFSLAHKPSLQSFLLTESFPLPPVQGTTSAYTIERMLATEHMTRPSSILKKKLKMKLFSLAHSLLFNPCFSQSVFRFTNNQGGNQQHIVAHSSSTSRVRPSSSQAWQQQNPQQTHLPTQNQRGRERRKELTCLKRQEQPEEMGVWMTGGWAGFSSGRMTGVSSGWMTGARVGLLRGSCSYCRG